ncbi:MAG: distal tail protein Dit [Enterocloster aldenensis]
MIHQSVSINGIDMLSTYGMALANRHCVQPPVPKTIYQDVPGADGSLDLSTAIAGRIIYERRVITLNFGCGYPMDKWPEVFSEILRNFHGREGKLIFDDDPMYYYAGRMTVSEYSRARTLGTFTISVNADPYKYELTASDEDWLWDSFSFEKGVIRNYKELEVNGSLSLTVPGTQRWVIPEIMVSAAMTLSYEGKDYDLKQGTNKIYDIVIKEGENMLMFTGTGTVTISYRGGIL